MAPRLDLQNLLENLLGSRNVYFQPPPSFQMKYPCIIYKRNDRNIDHANNTPYHSRKRYQVTVVDQDPDSSIPDKVAELSTASFDRHFVADNLNHDVYNIFF